MAVLLRALLLCVVVALAQAKQRLVQIPLEANSFEILPKLIPDRADLEEVGHDFAKVWATDEQVKELIINGFEVTKDVEHTSRLNGEKALRQRNVGIANQDEPNWSQFINYDDMTIFLQDLANSCPMYTLTSAGATVQNRQMWVIELNANAGPEVLMAGNIHGDETVGGQLLLRFLYDLCKRSSTDSRLVEILREVHLFVMPMMNPDGYMLNRRGNAQNIDLNRDFPNVFTSPDDSPVGRAVETVHFMNFAAVRNFKLSLMYHGGAVVANYAYDSIAFGSRPGEYSPTDRDELVTQLALDYSTNHTTMSQSNQFPRGIVNGAQWYVIYGSLQDFMYDFRGCSDLTLEVSQIKWPAGSTLPGFYDANYDSIVTYILNARIV